MPDFTLLQENESKLLCLQGEQKGEYIIIFVLYPFQPTAEVSCPGGGGGVGKRRGLGPTNDVLTTCKAVNPRANQLSSKVAVCFLMISTLSVG